MFDLNIVLDLKTVNINKAEFINLLMECKIFTVFSDLYNEIKEEDEEFFV